MRLPLSITDRLHRIRALDLVFQLVPLERAVLRQVLRPPDLPVLLRALPRLDLHPLDDRAGERVDLRHDQAPAPNRTGLHLFHRPPNGGPESNSARKRAVSSVSISFPTRPASNESDDAG